MFTQIHTPMHQRASWGQYAAQGYSVWRLEQQRIKPPEPPPPEQQPCQWIIHVPVSQTSTLLKQCEIISTIQRRGSDVLQETWTTIPEIYLKKQQESLKESQAVLKNKSGYLTLKLVRSVQSLFFWLYIPIPFMFVHLFKFFQQNIIFLRFELHGQGV